MGLSSKELAHPFRGSAWIDALRQRRREVAPQARANDADAALVTLVDTGVSNGTIAVDWTPTAASQTLYGYPAGAIVFRWVDATHYWLAGVGIGGYALSVWKREGDAMGPIASTDIPSVAGRSHRLGVTVNGASIQVSWDGAVELSITDGFDQLATQHGLWWWTGDDGGSAFDNFSVRTLTAPVISHITVTPASPTIGKGGSQIFVAQAYDQNNAPVVSSLFQWAVTDATAAQFVQVAPYTNTFIAHGIARPFTVTATSVWNVLPASATVSVDSSHTLVYDSFSGTQVTTIPNHLPDIYPPLHGWTTLGSSGAYVDVGQTFGGTQGAAGAYAGAMIETGATDGLIGMDWAPGSAQTEAPGYSEGLLAFRIKDANNFLVAGFGLAGYPFALGAYVNGVFSLIQATTPPTPIAGTRTRRVEALLDGARITIQVDGGRVLDSFTALYADATSHGILWRTAEDWGSPMDNFTVTGAPRCVTSVSMTSTSVDWPGGSTTLNVNAPADCHWDVSSDSGDWLGPPIFSRDGDGTSSVPIIVDQDLGWNRTAHVVVSGRITTLAQVGAGQVCQPLPIDAWFTATNFSGGGGSADIGVIDERYCAWSASTDSPWVHLLATSGSASARFTYTVDANGGAERVATITITGVIGEVAQQVVQGAGGTTVPPDAGPSCSYQVRPFYMLFGSAGGSQSVTVSAPAGCSATVSLTAPWVHLNSTQGVGTWNTTLTVDANLSSSQRSAALQFGSATLTIDELTVGEDASLLPLLPDGADASFAVFAWTTDPQTGAVFGLIDCCLPGQDPPIIVTPPIGGSGGGGCGGNGGPLSRSPEFVPGMSNPIQAECGGGVDEPPPPPPPPYCYITNSFSLTILGKPEPDGLHLAYAIPANAPSDLQDSIRGAFNSWNALTSSTQIIFDVAANGQRAVQFVLDAQPPDIGSSERCAYYNNGTIAIMPTFGALIAANPQAAQAIIMHEIGHLLALEDAGESNNPPTIMTNAKKMDSDCLAEGATVVQLTITDRDATNANTCVAIQRNK